MNSSFTSLTDFVAMGGYAYYVWPAYGLTLVILLINVIWAIKKTHAIKYKLKKLKRS